MDNTQAPTKDIYKTSRAMFIAWALFDCVQLSFAGGAYFAKLSTTVGISDGMTAILSTIISLAGAFQVVSILLAHKTPVKRWVVPLELLFRLMLGGMYLIPFLPMKDNADIVIFIILLVSYALREIILPVTSAWFMNLVPTEKIGSFSAKNMSISLVGSIAFTFVMSNVIDRFEANGNINGAFLILSLSIFTLTLICVSCTLLTREKPVTIERKVSAFSEVKSIVKNKKFIVSVAILVCWTFISSCIAPFLNTYQINELGFSMTLITVISTVGSLVRLAFTLLCGKLSISRSMLWLLQVGYTLCLLSFVVIIFTSPKNGLVMFLIYTVLIRIGEAATSIGNTVVYSIVKIEQRTAALAVRSIISGTASILATLAITPLFNYVKDNLGGEIFGIPIYAQQVLALVAVVLGIPYLIFLFSRHARVLAHTSVD